jgi:hypothetical protein
MNNKLPYDLKNYRAPRTENMPQITAYLVVLMLLITLLGWMENRDREYLAELTAHNCTNTQAL